VVRVIGTETEFGIAARNVESLDPVAHSLQLIGQCPALPAPQAIWDYENENPLLDARGFEVEGERERPGPEYNRLLNKPLANGVHEPAAGGRLRARRGAHSCRLPVRDVPGPRQRAVSSL
jgi:hypothetical protein